MIISEDIPLQVAVETCTASAFRALLRYLYTDQLDFNDDIITDVMQLAHQYDIRRVYAHCVRHMTRNLAVNNAVQWFIQAHELNMVDPRQRALGFIARNWRKIKAEASSTVELLRKHGDPGLLMAVLEAV